MKTHKYDNRQWKTAAGKVLLWKDMDIDHLSNCYHFTRRKGEQVLINALADYATGSGVEGKIPNKRVLVDYAYTARAGLMQQARRFIEYIEFRVTVRGR